MNTRLSITRLTLVLPLATGLLLTACGPASTPVPPTAAPFPLVSRAVSYTYDDAGRLTRAEYDNGASTTYTYDNAGNLLSREVTAASGESPAAIVGTTRPQSPPSVWPLAALAGSVGALIALRQRMAKRINEYVRQSHSFTRSGCAKQFVDIRNPHSTIRIPHSAFRLFLALSFLASALGLTPGTARADECPPDTRVFSISGGTPGAVLVVIVGGATSTATLDANGQTSLTVPLTGAVNVSGPGTFNITVVCVGSAGGGQGSSTGAGGGQGNSTGAGSGPPSGSQGQSNTGSSSTSGNSFGNSGTAGDPVSTSIGEYSFSLPLLDLGSRIPIQFALYYASRLDKSAGAHNDPFGGDQFSHNFYVALQRVDDATATVFFGNGNLATFEKSSGGWAVTGEEIIFQLQEDDGRYFLLDPIVQRIYTFDKASVSGQRVGVLARVEDRNGSALTFTNDPAGRVTRVEDGLGRSLDFTYTNPTDEWDWPHLSQVADQTGRAVQFGYQVTTEDVMTIHLTAVTDTLGLATTFNHTGPVTDTVVSAFTLPLGNMPYSQTYEQIAEPALSGAEGGGWQVSAQTDAYGNTTDLSFAENPGTAMTDPLGNTSQHTHEDERLLTGWTDTAGNTAAFTYDDAGRRTSITDRLGDTTTFTYHPETGKMASITNARGETTAFTYTAQEQAFFSPSDEEKKTPLATFIFHNLTRADYPDGTHTEIAYDERGNVITRTDRAGMTRTHTYNDAGQVLTAVNPAGGVVTFTYNDDATLASRANSESGTTTFAYDEYKRLAQITRPDSSVVQIAYDLADRLTSLTDENGGAYAYEYDANGNLVKITDPAGAATQYAYDLMDRLTQITNRVGQVSNLSYDPMGRLASLTDPTGVETAYGYDPRGWRNAVSRNGQTWQTAYDAEGVPSSNTTPLGYTTAYQTDALGLLAAVADPLGHTATFTRDALNRVTGITDPLGRATEFAYDARGLLASVSPPALGAATYTRNELGLITGIADLNEQQWTFDYSPIGRLTSTADPLGNTAQYAYDDRGRLITTTLADGAALDYEYDAAGNLTGLQDLSGLGLTYTYDPLNRLTETDGLNLTYDAEGRVTLTSNLQLPTSGFGATYDAAGRVQTVTYGDALTVTYAYDETTGLLASVADSLTNSKIEFTYDADRRLVGVTRSNGVNTALTWDAAGRLTGIRDAKTSEVSQTSEVLNLQYTLDAAGQVTGAQITAPLDPASNFQLQTSNFQYDKASQVNTDGYRYDAQGRLTQSPDGEFNWDALSRLTAVNDTTLTYNALGDLVSRKEGDQATHYAYNYALGLNPIVAEMDDAGKPSRYYVWSPDSGTLLYMIDAASGNAVSFYHFDRTGSTLALTDADGAITDAYAYDPYGQLLAHEGDSTQPFTFVGRWGVRQEGASGSLYHMRARYYDATTARFLSRDSAWPKVVEPRELNPYVYARSNPIGRGSPTGIDPEFNDSWRFHDGNNEWEQTVPPNPAPGGGPFAGNRETPNKPTQSTFDWQSLYSVVNQAAGGQTNWSNGGFTGQYGTGDFNSNPLDTRPVPCDRAALARAQARITTLFAQSESLATQEEAALADWHQAVDRSNELREQQIRMEDATTIWNWTMWTSEFRALTAQLSAAWAQSQTLSIRHDEIARRLHSVLDETIAAQAVYDSLLADCP